MTYSARDTINLRAKNVPRSIRKAFEERAARALIYHGGNSVIAKHGTDEWPMLVMKAKQDMQGHFDAEVIHNAELRLV